MELSRVKQKILVKNNEYITDYVNIIFGWNCFQNLKANTSRHAFAFTSEC